MQYLGERCARTINKELIPRTLLISTGSVVYSNLSANRSQGSYPPPRFSVLTLSASMLYRIASRNVLIQKSITLWRTLLEASALVM